MKSGPAKVLIVGATLNRGGAETFIMNMCRNSDVKRVNYDFLSTLPGEFSFSEEFRGLGGKIIQLKNFSPWHPIKTVREIRRIISENGPYDAIHSHLFYFSGLIMLAAKKENIPIRISHSHTTSKKNKKGLMKLYYSIMRKFILKCSTKLVACGQEAAENLFGKNIVQKEKVQIVPNGIDVAKYQNKDIKKVNKLKSELDIPKDSLIVGHIGRFSEPKNHKFILSLVGKCKVQQKNIKFILIGDGEKRKEIEQLALDMDLNENVIFTGLREDIPELLHIFDILILPSLWEGLPVTLIEAQAACIPCIVSTNVSSEVDMGLGLIESIGINENDIVTWINEFDKMKNRAVPTFDKANAELTKSGYNITENMERIYKLYGC